MCFLVKSLIEICSSKVNIKEVYLFLYNFMTNDNSLAEFEFVDFFLNNYKLRSNISSVYLRLNFYTDWENEKIYDLI